MLFLRSQAAIYDLRCATKHITVKQTWLTLTFFLSLPSLWIVTHAHTKSLLLNVAKLLFLSYISYKLASKLWNICPLQSCIHFWDNLCVFFFRKEIPTRKPATVTALQSSHPDFVTGETVNLVCLYVVNAYIVEWGEFWMVYWEPSMNDWKRKFCSFFWEA